MTSVRRIPRLLLAAVLLTGAAAPGLVCPASGADIRIPPSPARWATDKAGFLSPATLREIDAVLEAWERATGHQFLLYIDRTTDGEPIENFAVQAFRAWRVGRKGLDDGVVLFIMAEDRKVRIEVGYGLEDRITDLKASRVVNDILLPGIRAGDPDGAVRRAVAEVQSIASGEESPAGETDPVLKKPDKIPTVLIVIGGIVFLIILITNPSFAIWLLINLLSGGRGGGGGGGGGFGGGGGRSGGGGASGGW